jgi:hypothetical protein
VQTYYASGLKLQGSALLLGQIGQMGNPDLSSRRTPISQRFCTEIPTHKEMTSDLDSIVAVENRFE